MKTFCLFLLMGCSVGAFAQNLSQSVAAAAGDYSKNLQTGHSITWTLGELTTEFLQQEVNLQQGFHQGDLQVVVQTAQSFLPSSAWEAFPIPTDYYVKIRTDFARSWQYEIFDMLGKKILQGTAHQPTIQIDLPKLEAGIYFIQIKNSSGISSSKKLIIQQ